MPGPTQCSRREFSSRSVVANYSSPRNEFNRQDLRTVGQMTHPLNNTNP